VTERLGQAPGVQPGYTTMTGQAGAGDGDLFPPRRCSLGAAEPGSGSGRRYRSKSRTSRGGQGRAGANGVS